ncbi:MAG TPA: oxygen-independent coproporphyrinogen III oxidase [Myxococcales bacterium LLY-WYZ-16_1]|nr:oxygen-independent coproporphyrinogen III oxidase [Myxococcales bacterium LLY-WYZ-16_1]
MTALAPAFPAVDEALVSRYDVAGPRYTSYPPVPVWRTDTRADDRIQALQQARTDKGLALYVHLPFCESRCRFCGCNVVVAKDRDRAEAYIDRVLQEFQSVLDLWGDRRPRLRSLHLGGGTPTFLREDQLNRLLRPMLDAFELDEDKEFALEAEPSVTTESQLKALADLGFDRISFGVQDLDESVLEMVERPSRRRQVQALTEAARSLGFRSVNYDFIYGLPGQVPERWAETLEGLLELQPDRVAIYSFAYLPEQRPHQKRLGRFWMPTGPDKLGLFAQAYRRLLRGGYRAVGMDHFALPSDSLAVAQREGSLGRNFQGYTTHSEAEVLGLGMSAISDIGGWYLQNPSVLRAYDQGVETGRWAPARAWRRSREDDRRRRVIQGLMCNFQVHFREGDVAALRSELQRLAEPEYRDLVNVSFDGLDLTPLGRIFVRNVAMVFDDYSTDRQSPYSRTV